MLKVKELANKFNLKIIGNHLDVINGVAEIHNQKNNQLSWIKSKNYLNQAKTGFILVNENINFNPNKNITFLITKENPKLIFSKIINNYFSYNADYYLKDETDFHRKNKNIKIGANVFIGQNVTIGKGTIIHPFVVIEANTVIGENCILKAHTSIGTDGLGFVIDKKNDEYVKFPQIGNVVIEDNVELGPSTTVRRGALKETRIKSGAKIGSLINIGHNCIIGKNTILTCNIVTSGSSTVGDYTFIGVNSVIRNGVSVGKNTQIGMGSIVTKNIPDNVVAYGNPAKVIRKNA